MDTSIFKYGELPEFKKFTSESISKEFPLVLEKIAEDFKNIEKNLSNSLMHNDLNWDVDGYRCTFSDLAVYVEYSIELFCSCRKGL